MINRTARFAALAALSVAALSLAACSDDDSSSKTSASQVTEGTESRDVVDEPATTNAPALPADLGADGSATIKVTVGTDDFETSGGTRVVSVPVGTEVTIEITAADAESYHLHGYDIEVDADAGETAKLSFTATETGQFDLESHITENTLLVLVVE